MTIQSWSERRRRTELRQGVKKEKSSTTAGTFGAFRAWRILRGRPPDKTAGTVSATGGVKSFEFINGSGQGLRKVSGSRARTFSVISQSGLYIKLISAPPSLLASVPYIIRNSGTLTQSEISNKYPTNICPCQTGCATHPRGERRNSGEELSQRTRICVTDLDTFRIVSTVSIFRLIENTSKL